MRLFLVLLLILPAFAMRADFCTTRPSHPKCTTGYTFVDEFDGSVLAPHWYVINGPGISGNNEATFDAAHATVSDGYLRLTAERLSPGSWVSGYIDTSRGRFRQQYGVWEARIQIPKGYGLWPAFWAIAESGSGPYSWGPGEIDPMEVCANPIGTRGGLDASLVNSTIHYSGGQSGYNLRTVDLSADFHVYRMEWRSDAIRFYLDGQLYASHTGPMPTGQMVVALDLAVGDAWCGPSDPSTPSPSVMLVDWVRIRA